MFTNLPKYTQRLAKLRTKELLSKSLKSSSVPKKKKIFLTSSKPSLLKPKRSTIKKKRESTLRAK